MKPIRIILPFTVVLLIGIVVLLNPLGTADTGPEGKLRSQVQDATTASTLLDMLSPGWRDIPSFRYEKSEQYYGEAIEGIAVGWGVVRHRFSTTDFHVSIYAKADTLLLVKAWGKRHGGTDKYVQMSLTKDSAKLRAWRENIWSTMKVPAPAAGFCDSVFSAFEEGRQLEFSYNCGFGMGVPDTRSMLLDAVRAEKNDVAAALVGSLDPELRLFGLEAYLAMMGDSVDMSKAESLVSRLIRDSWIYTCSGCEAIGPSLGKIDFTIGIWHDGTPMWVSWYHSKR